MSTWWQNYVSNWLNSMYRKYSGSSWWDRYQQRLQRWYPWWSPPGATSSSSSAPKVTYRYETEITESAGKALVDDAGDTRTANGYELGGFSRAGETRSRYRIKYLDGKEDSRTLLSTSTSYSNKLTYTGSDGITETRTVLEGFKAPQYYPYDQHRNVGYDHDKGFFLKRADGAALQAGAGRYNGEINASLRKTGYGYSDLKVTGLSDTWIVERNGTSSTNVSVSATQKDYRWRPNAAEATAIAADGVIYLGSDTPNQWAQSYINFTAKAKAGIEGKATAIAAQNSYFNLGDSRGFNNVTLTANADSGKLTFWTGYTSQWGSYENSNADYIRLNYSSPEYRITDSSYYWWNVKMNYVTVENLENREAIAIANSTINGSDTRDHVRLISNDQLAVDSTILLNGGDDALIFGGDLTGDDVLTNSTFDGGEGIDKLVLNNVSRWEFTNNIAPSLGVTTTDGVDTFTFGDSTFTNFEKVQFGGLYSRDTMTFDEVKKLVV